MFAHKVNGMAYIGQSVNIERRYKDHRSRINGGRSENSKFHEAAIIDGFDSFSFTVLEECLVEELNEKEIYYIGQYNTLFPNGYNTSPGGSSPHTNKLSSFSDVGEIINLLRSTNLTNSEIGMKFGVSDQTISDINCGRIWFSDKVDYPVRNRGALAKGRAGKRKYHACIRCGKCIHRARATGMCVDCYNLEKSKGMPDKKELYEALCRNSFEKVASKYGVSSNAVRKWCQKHGIPKTAHYYRSLDRVRSSDSTFG